jgi:two-component system nitrate/nitrite response regulator NarL
VLSLLVEGESSQSISHSLSLSPHTVRTHIQNILTKLGVHSRFEAASFAVRFALALEPARTTAQAGGGEGAA